MEAKIKLKLGNQESKRLIDHLQAAQEETQPKKMGIAQVAMKLSRGIKSGLMPSAKRRF